MIPRRLVRSGAAACGMAAALPLRAADRPNPMPEELRAALERDPTAPVLGNPDGDITLSVANVDLVYVGLRALVSSVATAERERIPLPGNVS